MEVRKEGGGGERGTCTDTVPLAETENGFDAVAKKNVQWHHTTPLAQAGPSIRCRGGRGEEEPEKGEEAEEGEEGEEPSSRKDLSSRNHITGVR